MVTIFFFTAKSINFVILKKVVSILLLKRKKADII